MKKIISIIFFLAFKMAYTSSFEIKVALNLNDCVKCNNYLYNLNNISIKYKIILLFNNEMRADSTNVMEQIKGSKLKNYKIEISDSLYKLYTSQSQNYISVLKNKQLVLGFLLKNINAKIDSLNTISFEDGDSIPINYNANAVGRSKIIGNKLYFLKVGIYAISDKNNGLYITNLTNQTNTKYAFPNDLTTKIFTLSEKGIQKLTEVKKFYEEQNEKYELSISSFDVDSNNLYLMVVFPYIEEISEDNLDTTISKISTLLVFKNGNKEPLIYFLNKSGVVKDYEISESSINVQGNDVFIDVLTDQKNYIRKSFWLCKCKLLENIEFDTSKCIGRPKLHIELGLNVNFRKYILTGDYLINNITNELINHQTKESKELNIPFQKIIYNRRNIAKIIQKFVLNDIKITDNEAQIIYNMDNSYYYVKYDLVLNKIIETFVLFNNGTTLNVGPKLFSENLVYYFPQNSNVMVLKEIKPEKL